MQGLSFTPGELRALLFLLALLGLGTAVQVYKRMCPGDVTTYRIEYDSTAAEHEPVLTDTPESKLTAGIDPNRASAEDLELLPGVGPTLARAIVAYRLDHPEFKKADDLLQVPGIGPRTLARFRPHLTFP